MAAALSQGQLDRLEAMEIIIRNGFSTFCEVGNALMCIRDQKLYVEQYENFEAYCSERWHMHASYAYRQINAAQVYGNLKNSSEVANLCPIGNESSTPGLPFLPENEAQIRPLASLPPKDQVKAWTAAVHEAKTVPPANVVRKVARQFLKCPRCSRLGTPSKDCQACKRLRKGTPNKPSPVKPPKIEPLTGLAGACRQMLEELYKEFGTAHDTQFQAILLAAHDLDDAIAERRMDLRLGPETEGATPTDDTVYRFEAFWKAYPRKTSKKDAERAFNNLNPSRELYLQIMTAIERQKQWDGWKEGYIPEAARWLHGEKWNDEEPRKKGAAKMSGLREWAEKTIGARNHDEA